MSVIISFLPIVIFLFILIKLDSFKLVKISFLILCVVWGMASAGIAYFINSEFVLYSHMPFQTFLKFVSPVIEEVLKALLVIILIKRNKIAFAIDAAIYGFAIGTGFSVIENSYFLYELESQPIVLWLIRGFGTAIMHGGTSSIFAIVASLYFSKQKSIGVSVFYGLILAIGLHMFFNNFILPPIPTSIIILITICFFEYFTFRFSNRSMLKWLNPEFDAELLLLNLIWEGKMTDTRSGKYIESLRNKFSPLVVIDIIAFITLYLELSIRAKSNLMLKEANLPVVIDKELKGKLKELNILEKNIGKTGIIAINPILKISRKQLIEWSMTQ